MEKDFDELTIADDYMFYRVMEDPEICKMLLNRVLQDKVETITDIELQKKIDDAGRAKGVRFDVWATDCNGRIYDIEMQAIDKQNVFDIIKQQLMSMYWKRANRMKVSLIRLYYFSAPLTIWRKPYRSILLRRYAVRITG